MNYFPFYADPVKSAQCLDDKRITRVFAESVYVQSWYQTKMLGIEGPYGYNNPRCPKTLWSWLTDDPAHTEWHARWVRALLAECVHRNSADRVRQYSSYAKWSKLHIWLQSSPNEELKPVAFVNMARATVKDLDYTHYEDVHEAYRDYIAYQWLNLDVRPCRWTNREPPEFYPTDAMPPELRHFVEGITS